MVSNVYNVETTLYPPLNSEIPVALISAPVTAGNQVKVDYTINLGGNMSDLYYFAVEIRLYRDGTRLINRLFRQTGTVQGSTDCNYIITQNYVDTAPVTTTSTYEVRVITQYVENVTILVSVYNNNINLLII